MSLSLWVIITIGLILFIICCVFGIRIFLTYNTLRLSQKDRSYTYGDMRPLRQQRTTLLQQLVASHKGELSEQQKNFLAAITPALQRENANEKEIEIPLLNVLINSAPGLLASYGSVRQEKQRTPYEQFIQLTQELAPKKRHYNMLTKQYNTRLSLFPGDLISNISHLNEETLFKLTTEEARGTPAETIW